VERISITSLYYNSSSSSIEGQSTMSKFRPICMTIASCLLGVCQPIVRGLLLAVLYVVLTFVIPLLGCFLTISDTFTKLLLLFFFTHIIPDAIIQPLFQTYTSFYNPTVSEITFLEFFEQFGDVIDSVVMIDRQTKRSRGFGFVTFADEVSSLFLFVG
jgi:hypothetical protein